MALDEFGIDWEAEAAQLDKQKQPAPTAGAIDPSVQVTQPADEGRNFFQDVLVNGVAGGVEQATRGAYATVKGGAELAGADLPELGKPIIDAPEGITASITRDVTQFGLGFVGGLGILKGIGVAGKLAPVAKEIMASAVGTGVVADPTAPRLSNLIQKYPWLENPVNEYLSQDDKDGALESKFKATLEDMMTTPVAMVLFKSVKGLKHAIKGDQAGTAQMADEIAKAVSSSADASTSGKAAVQWKTDQMPADLDLFKAMPGGEVGTKINMVNVADIVHGHPMDSPDALKSIEKYKAEFAKDPSKIPAIIREEMPDGTFQSPSGNGRLAAARALGIEKVPAVDFRSADTVKAKLAKAAAEVDIKGPSGRTVFKLSGDEAKAFDAHLNHIVSNDHLEDIFNIPEFKAFNDARSTAMPETKELVEALSSYVGPKLDARIGKSRTHAETEKLADLLGEDSKLVYANLQQSFQHVQNLDATLTASKGLLYSSVREMRRLATKVRFETSTDVDKQALEMAEKRATDILGMVLGVRKGAARATSAGRIATGERDIDELIDLLALTKSEKEAVSLLKSKSFLGKLIDAHNEVWINGILSGVKTHVVNMASATANTLLTPANQIIGGVLTRNAAEVREGFALYRGLSRHIFDSLEMAARAFKAEKAVLDPGKSTDESIGKAITSKNFETLGRFADFIGSVARIPGRFLKSEDEFFKQMNYRAKVEAGAAREAADLVAGGKLDPKKMVSYTDGSKTTQISEVESFMREKFKSAFSMDNAGNNKEAIDYSREITFTQDLNSISTYDWFGNPGAKIQQFAASHPWLRGTLLPFIKVPTNLMRAVGDLTPPIAMLKKEGMDILTGTNVDPHKKAMFMGRLSTGTMLWTGAGMLALQGRVTGAAFGDKEMRARQLESGWQPYSFVFEKADGTKEYVSYQRLDPFGTFFGLAADWAYISQHVDAETGNNWATAATLAVAKNIASKSYLQGLVEWSSMIGGGYSAEDQTARLFQMRAASYVPNYMNLYTGDDELKAVRSMTDAMMAKILGLSSAVEAKRDYFGEKRVAPMGYPWNAIDPFPVSHDKDAVRTELARLSRSQSEVRFEMPNTKMGTLDLTQMKTPEGRTAYDLWTEKIGKVEINGKTFHAKMAEVIDSQRYKDGNDGTSVYHNGSRVVMLKNWQEKYREKALRETLKEFSGLKEAVKQDKRNERAVKHGREDAVKNLLEFGVR